MNDIENRCNTGRNGNRGRDVSCGFPERGRGVHYKAPPLLRIGEKDSACNPLNKLLCVLALNSNEPFPENNSRQTLAGREIGKITYKVQ